VNKGQHRTTQENEEVGGGAGKAAPDLHTITDGIAHDRHEKILDDQLCPGSTDVQVEIR
jgi:hypothetical protein